MFDFFEGTIEKLGIKLISDFTDKLYKWIKEIKNNSKREINDKGVNDTKIGTSGDCTQIGTSGYRTQIGTSGHYTKIGTSGDYTQIGTSGDCPQIGTSGYRTQIGTSGDCTKIDISGNDSVGFACGRKSIIKAKKGTWISLCEYEWNKEKSRHIPIYALSAQIGNIEYKDFRGRILKENEYYCLFNKKFYPVDISDGIEIIKISEKKKDGITIIKGQNFDNEEVYVVKENDLSAHGETSREALEDLNYKKLESEETEEIVKEIKETGKVTKGQYRAITGACQFGTNKFCKEHNITDEEISLDELRKILIDDYGAKQFWSLIEED